MYAILNFLILPGDSYPTVSVLLRLGWWRGLWIRSTSYDACVEYSFVVVVDEHGHLKIYLPKKLLECLPKCTSLPKERHRWNTNEVRPPLLITHTRCPQSIPSQRHLAAARRVLSGPYFSRNSLTNNITFGAFGDPVQPSFNFSRRVTCLNVTYEKKEPPH